MRRQEDGELTLPPAHQRTWLALEHLTDYAAFQQLSDEVLSAYWGYKIHPRGMSARGTVRGQPDSWGHDFEGKLCSFEYGASPDWRSKLEKDLAEVASIPGFSPQVFVFCTNRFVSADAEREYTDMVLRDYNWELRLYGQGELAIPLDTTWQDIRKRHLHIDVEHHNWASLLAACTEQRQKILVRYRGKYEPAVYVQRHAEQKVDSWYRQAMIDIYQGKTTAQLLAVVDQAGAGKTNLVLHLAEQYGSLAPVIVIPGSRTINDDYALEREIVEAVGYPVEGRTYHANVYELCQIAQHEGYPLLVVLDGINENSDPRRIRNALEHLLTAYQDYSLLVLITCRDVVWPLVQSPLVSHFVAEEQVQDTDNGVVSLGLFDDDEFEQACERYFTHWHVAVSLSVEAARSLRSPLLLRIFTEVYQHRPFSFVPAVVNKDLWTRYRETKINVVYEAMGQNINKRAIGRAIERIALHMFELDRPHLFLDELTGIDPHLNPDDTSSQSLLLQLQNAAVLVESHPETIGFVYEPFFEFVLGKALARMFEELAKREGVLARVEALASIYRWRQVPLYIAELVSEPDAIIERLRTPNLWLAAQALRRVSLSVSAEIRRQVIADLVGHLDSRFPLDRRRAADLLGLLEAYESKDELFRCWSAYESQAALRALARLGVGAIIEPFIRYLGRFLEWHLPDDRELVNALPEDFRRRLTDRAIALLDDSELMFAAAHTLGYLRAPQAVAPLLTHLEATEWGNWVALSTLLQIGTQEALDVLERGIGEIGARIVLCDQQADDREIPPEQRAEITQTRDELYGVLMHVRVRGLQHSPVKVILPLLMRLLEQPNSSVRSEAIRSLGNLGAAEAAPAMITFAGLEDGFMMSNALHAFGTQIPVEPLLAFVEDSATSDMVLHYAIEALGTSRDKRMLRPLSQFIAQRRFLEEAIQALGNSRLPAAVPILAHVLEDNAIDFSGQKWLNRENLDSMVIENLGKLRHPDAFVAVERFARANLPGVWYVTIEALAASGGEQAIPLLRELWEHAPEKQKTIIRALLWIGTPAASEAMVELLDPPNGEKVTLLVDALSRGQGLDFITGTTSGVGVLSLVGDRLVTIIDIYFDELTTEGKWNAVRAMKYLATPSARCLLERVATNLVYDIPLPGSPGTLREATIPVLCDLGSAVVIEAVLDTLPDLPLALIEFRLEKMERGLVNSALHRRLNAANESDLIGLLTLLGIFGDHSVLADLRAYIDDPRQKVANAAYEANQRILGLADL